MPDASPPSSAPILYSFRRCPYAMRARLALAVSAITCELREVVLRDKPVELLKASPKGTVPVLVLPNGDVIDQSLDIMHWALQQNDPEQWLQPERETLPAMEALIAQCDREFKANLDRYKYPDRYPGTDPLAHRHAGAAYLAQLEIRLSATPAPIPLSPPSPLLSFPYLFGRRATLADMAIAPFVRQFAHTDAEWFRAQPWPALIRWLDNFTDSTRFNLVMEKAPPWIPGTAGVRFPPH
ncbi:glutathione S-transferase [Bordetella sp. LUAb4]|uniref:glutathione S-transferase n=1 Tax=Bordetella sp. LUAb4 TaxID=2843195 RepID=UPI001E5B3E2A|nr:glutathione S-transferase [Bordetella sp. LUAb4]